MRPRIYDDKAPRIPVTVHVNGDLHAKIAAAGLDVDTIVERALIAAWREQIQIEINRDLEACDRFVAEHGSFSEMVREHYDRIDADAPV